MSFWGGFNTHQILEYLNYDLIKKNPKVLIGIISGSIAAFFTLLKGHKQ
jgi:uncharacterized membrane protein